MFKPKLASIISNITKQVAQLSQLVEENRLTTDANNDQITRLQQENSELQTESIKAQRIATRLNELVS